MKDIFTTTFMVITVIATIFSLIPFKWEPKYIITSSMQLMGIIGFSFFAIKKFLINSEASILTRIWRFLPILTMFGIISVIFFILVSGRNKFQTGSVKLFNSIYKYPSDLLLGAWIKYFFMQLLLLIQMFNLKNYVFPPMEKNVSRCGISNYYMKLFYVATIINLIPIGLLWSEIGPLSAEG
jgi:hypothetical protein